jgi:hypothetical protein
MNDTNLHIEVLKIARDLLMDEYVELVNQSEERWAAESALYWRAQQIMVDYPALPAPPSVDRILEKAEQLLAFFNGTVMTTCYPEPAPAPEPEPTPEPAPEPAPEPESGQ